MPTSKPTVSSKTPLISSLSKGMAPLVAGDASSGMDVLPDPYSSTIVRDRAKGELAGRAQAEPLRTRPRRPARQVSLPVEKRAAAGAGW
jgi:hypothetical protein